MIWQTETNNNDATHTAHTFLWQRKWAKKKIWKCILNFSYSFFSITTTATSRIKMLPHIEYSAMFISIDFTCCALHVFFCQFIPFCTFPLPTLLSLLRYAARWYNSISCHFFFLVFVYFHSFWMYDWLFCGVNLIEPLSPRNKNYEIVLFQSF